MQVKKLGELLQGLPYELDCGSRDTGIEALAYDSRECSPGTLFVCVPGFNVDGHDFIPEALSRGASALLVQKKVEVPSDVTVARVQSTREAMGIASSLFFNKPSEKLNLTGITGTNGKTSVAFLINALDRHIGRCTGMLGTVENRIGDEKLAVKRTTPESMDLQFLLSRMVDVGCSHAVMEVSSHAVALKRIGGCVFRTACFTNLTQDHLDFHDGIDEYFEAKKGLFTDYLDGDGVAILNGDDPYCKKISNEIENRVVLFGIKGNDLDIRAKDISCTTGGISYSVESKFAEEFRVESPLMGGFNVYNTLNMVAYGLANDIDKKEIIEALSELKGIPGRFERIDLGQEARVFVDYAHTPDGLKNVLNTAEEICSGKLIVVFGAGGDRDKSKRPLMGAVAAERSDIVVVTNDNPRTENPEQIIDQIVLGVEQAMMQIPPSKQFRYIVEPDRFAAISTAIDNAGPDDVVVIAGKGHEDYQIYRDRTIHFDDREVAKNIIRERMNGGNDVA
ncbi:MAG TPA: UDP-N-acetylmuramoyl-L-alanyl-D-glutamate--2,6-diaminopimelate ligase [bacterium]|nr:UDP-N-acetylmuramoyl-L-alanyl-D-glutamate--2,6-diaminopimelate ligase [bacterium]